MGEIRDANERRMAERSVRRAAWWVLAALTASAMRVRAQSAPGGGEDDARKTPRGKWSSNLFHPAPRALMRDMSTDCPDQTESPCTVDAGHFQVEMEAVSAVFDHDKSRGGDMRTTGWGASLNGKAGLLNTVDIQFVQIGRASCRERV